MKGILKFLLVVTVSLLTATPVFSQEPLCSNLIANGSFEEDGGWRWEKTPKIPSYTTETAWDGNRSMLLGNLDPSTDTLAFSSIWQDVSVPADAALVTLSFRYRLVSSDPQVFDEAKFVLLNPEGTSILAVPWREKRDTAGEWKEVVIDLTDLTRGKTLRFYFGVVNDGNGNPTAMYIDDVRLTVCSVSYTPTETPTPSEMIPTDVTPQPEATTTPLGIKVTPESVAPSPEEVPSPTPSPMPARPLPLVSTVSSLIIAGSLVTLVLLIFIVYFLARRRVKPRE